MADTLGLTDWQRKVAEDVADAMDRGERVQFVWGRRQGKALFRAFLDTLMAERGWIVVVPGVYRPPDEDNL